MLLQSLEACFHPERIRSRFRKIRKLPPDTNVKHDNTRDARPDGGDFGIEAARVPYRALPASQSTTRVPTQQTSKPTSTSTPCETRMKQHACGEAYRDMYVSGSRYNSRILVCTKKVSTKRETILSSQSVYF